MPERRLSPEGLTSQVRRGSEEERERGYLCHVFDVAGIPTLIIVDDKGETITKNGRSAINLDSEGKVASNNTTCIQYT